MTEEQVLALAEAMATVNGHPAPAEFAKAVAEAIKAKAAEKPKKEKK